MSDNEKDERLSQEDVLRIVKHFLLSSPPGEFEDVLSDVRELVGDDDLLNKGALDIFRQYNIEQLIPVDVTDLGYKSILCKYAEIDSSHYIDPRSNKILTVDHAKGVVTKVEDNTTTEKEEDQALREGLQKTIDKYINDHYLSGISTVFQSPEGENELVICITASKFNESNLWSGRWRSVYRVAFQDDKKVKVSGTMKVNVHYYERGNIQLNTSKEYGETISAKEDIHADITAAISKVEGAFQRDIDTACTNLTETFKGLRRRLPVNGTLFNFGSSGQHNLVEGMVGKGKKV